MTRDKPDPLSERCAAIAKEGAMRTAERIVKAVVGEPSYLPVVLEWYQWLPLSARKGMSLYHLHTLAKRLRAASGMPLREAGTAEARSAGSPVGEAETPKDSRLMGRGEGKI